MSQIAQWFPLGFYEWSKALEFCWFRSLLPINLRESHSFYQKKTNRNIISSIFLLGHSSHTFDRLRLFYIDNCPHRFLWKDYSCTRVVWFLGCDNPYIIGHSLVLSPLVIPCPSYWNIWPVCSWLLHRLRLHSSVFSFSRHG